MSRAAPPERHSLQRVRARAREQDSRPALWPCHLLAVALEQAAQPLCASVFSCVHWEQPCSLHRVVKGELEVLIHGQCLEPHRAHSKDSTRVL